MLDPEVHLAARVRIEVERAAPSRCERVRTCDYSLRLERFWKPRERHFRRNDPVQILLEPDEVDCTQLAVDDVDLNRAAVEMLQLQRGGARLEQQRARQRVSGRLAVDLELQGRRQGVVAGRNVVHRSGCVADAKVCGRADWQRRGSTREQHAHSRNGRDAELGAGKVVQDDLGVADAFLRVAVRAVLAHPHAVTPAVSGDDERRCSRSCGRLHACRRRRAGAEQEDGGDCERSTHRADPSEDSDEASKATHLQRLSLRNADLIVSVTVQRANSCERLWL